MTKELAIDLLTGYVVGTNEQLHEAVLMAVKAIQAEPKHGRWKIKAINTFDMAYGSTGYEPVYECSLCGAVEESYLRLDEPIMPEDADFPRYCPNCGSRMDLDGDTE